MGVTVHSHCVESFEGEGGLAVNCDFFFLNTLNFPGGGKIEKDLCLKGCHFGHISISIKPPLAVHPFSVSGSVFLSLAAGNLASTLF